MTDRENKPSNLRSQVSGLHFKRVGRGEWLALCEPLGSTYYLVRRGRAVRGFYALLRFQIGARRYTTPLDIRRPPKLYRSRKAAQRACQRHVRAQASSLTSQASRGSHERNQSTVPAV